MSAEHTPATNTKHRVSRPTRKPRQEESSRTGSRNASPLDDSSLYINRELSLLAFQRRVLEEAQDQHNPLLERVKFLSIVGSNLDEFFMVRVAGLKRQVESGVLECDPDGMTPKQQLGSIREQASDLFKAAHECLRRQLFPALKKAGLCVLDYSQLTSVQRTNVNKYFSKTVFPTLTPLAFDPGRPFPHISNLSLNLAVLIRDQQDVEHFARVKVPDILPQLVPVTPGAEDGVTRKKKAPVPQYLVWLEQVIMANLQSLFPGMEIIEAHPFHVTRDADSAIQELEAGDLLESVEEGVWQRRFADVIRLEVNDDMPPAVLEILQKNLEVDSDDVYQVGRPIALSRLKHLSAVDRPELRDKPFLPGVPAALRPEEEGEDIFTTRSIPFNRW